MTISRMQMERQLRAGGGLMTLEEPRQGYFLGKIVKKAKRAVKKVVKSPIGKIALAATAANFAPMLLGKGTLLQQAGGFSGLPGLFARSRLGTGLASGEGMLGQLGNLFRVGGKKGADLSLFRIGGGLLGAGAIAAPFFMGGDEEEVEEETPFTQTPDSISEIVEQARNRDASLRFLPEPEFVRNFYRRADGGIIDAPRMPMQEGGIMDLGGMEKDYRTGGFVDLGAEERADDVPARLSKNEFVFTADAVRNAGGGDIDRGAEVMQNMMDNLEAGGMISEESQGMNPAQEMFDQSQMLESRLA
jgi:hypothetical protein